MNINNLPDQENSDPLDITDISFLLAANTNPSTELYCSAKKLITDLKTFSDSGYNKAVATKLGIQIEYKESLH